MCSYVYILVLRARRFFEVVFEGQPRGVALVSTIIFRHFSENIDYDYDYDYDYYYYYYYCCCCCYHLVKKIPKLRVKNQDTQEYSVRITQTSSAL